MNRRNKIAGLTLAFFIFACICAYAANHNFTGSIQLKNFEDEEHYLDLVELKTSDVAKIAEELKIGQVTSIELDTEDGYLVYSVELNKENRRDELEVLIDPVTGEVLLVEDN